jgi:hypothetical protein
VSVDIGELRGIITLQDQFTGPIEKVTDALGISSQSFSAVVGAAGLAAGAIASATAAIVYLGDRGSAVDDVRSSFAGFAAEAGSTADVMLGALRDATDRTISDFELMKMSTTALGSGLVKTKDDMATLAAGARLLADRTGGDTKTAFDSLTGSMASGRTTQLAQLGIFVDSEKAVKEYAKATNKTTDDVSKGEKAHAVAKATLAALKDELQRSGAVQVDFSDRMAQGKVAVQNFVDNLALAVAKSPVVAAGMDAIASSMMGAFGSNQQEQIRTIMGYVNSFAIFMVDAASVAVRTAQVIVTGFTLIKVGANTMLQVLFEGLTKYADFLATIADKASALPVIGEKFVTLAKDLRGAADTTQALALGFEEVANKGKDSADKQGEFFGAIMTGLGNVSAAMEAAKNASVDLSVANEVTGQGLAAVGAAAQATGTSYTEMMKEAAEAYRQIAELAVETAAKQTELQQAVALANTSGLQQRLLEIEFQRQAELTALQEKLVLYPAIYEELAALVNEKYTLMGQAARGYHADIVVQANAAGFQTRQELETTAAAAIDTYERMKQSGLFTSAELLRAWEEAEKAKQALTAQTSTFTTATVGTMLTQVSGALSAFGVKYKALALAGAIITGISAVQKAWASAPFPINVPAVVATTTATLANVAAITRSGPGFEQGTGPGGAFMDFGRGTGAILHHEEAVVTRAQGESIADMVGDRMGERDTRTEAAIERLGEQLAADRRLLPIIMRDFALKARA